MIIESEIYSFFITLCIVLYTVIFALSKGDGSYVNLNYDKINLVFVIIFTIEMFGKLLVYGLKEYL